MTTISAFSGKTDTSSAGNTGNGGKTPLVKRFYTSEGETLGDVLGAVEWETRVTEVKSSKGEVVFSNKDSGGFEVPKKYSQLAGNIIAEKYARKAGCVIQDVDGIFSVPSGRPRDREISFKQIIFRVVRTIAFKAHDMGYLVTPEDMGTFNAELGYMLVHQIGAFNSPVWFNVGLGRWGCVGGDGNFYYRPGVTQKSPNDYARPQASACFILGREDTLEDIFTGVQEETRVFKHGSGAGSNFSKIRSNREKLSGGGLSSGLMSFLKVFDAAAGSTKSGGITRRAAKMVILNEDHPEILDFISWKANEEKKARILIDNGYDSNFNGEAYTTVGGQNGNNSVRVTDSFMEKATATSGDRSYSTTFRTNGNEICDTLDASDVLDKIAEAAWFCGDPGLQFDGAIQRWNMVADSGRIEATNPCSEFVFLDDTACNLASLNLLKFRPNKKNHEGYNFDLEAFRHACRIFILAQDVLVDLSSYPTEEIAKNSYEFRPLGLGYANLGAYLAMCGLPYGSEKGAQATAYITAFMTSYAYEMSADLAEAIGPAVFWPKNQKSAIRVLTQHESFLFNDISNGPGSGAFLGLSVIPPFHTLIQKAKRYGLRNAQVTVLAPTGTIGLMMDCDTTGIEPIFSFASKKELAGGGVTYIVLERLMRDVLVANGLSDNSVERAIVFYKEHGYMDAKHLGTAFKSVFLTAQDDGEGRSLRAVDHMVMMAAAQPYLSGAISKTVNLPNSATVADMRSAYVQAWMLGLKAVAVYRDGCKSSQPLTSMTKKAEPAAVAETPPAPAMAPEPTLTRHKMPSVALNASDRFKLTVGGQDVYLHVGKSEGRVLEIFLRGPQMSGDLLALLDCWCVATSYALQYGAPLEELVNKFTFIRFSPNGGVSGHPNIKFASSIVDLVWRVIGFHYLNRTDLVHVPPTDENPNYTEEVVNLMSEPVNLKRDKVVTSDAPFCSNCGHTTIRNGTCYKCLNCGNSEGCS
jgi:ribonucleoside-diphosphate reductase alpha chain